MLSRFRFAFILLSALFLLAMAGSGENGKPILGLTEKQAASQHELERQFDSHLNRENLSQWMKFLTSQPQPVGSPKSKENAEWVAEKFRSWGYEAEIEVFHVMFPTPKMRLLELIEPTKFTAKLMEKPVEGDASSAQTDQMLPPYNAYSADGDVTAELVYVNQGIPRDYEELARRGIDVKGKIVIARYGGSWRGIKAKVAHEKGAIGCILYSDPKDDGYMQGDVYPKGAYRNETGVQRGSVLDMPQYPGDPLTPGVGAKENTERMSIEESPTIMKIPVLPISYSDALPLLKALEGPVAPASWRGALPITYHIGPGPAKVHLKVEFSWDLTPAYNVIAKMKGAKYPDQWLIRGNHRDAWVHGAADPISGTVSMMEEARAIGELAKAGWKPKRTLIYCSWDAEEPALLGSTEWAEFHGKELKEKAVIYINTDGSGRGYLGMGGSHSLEKFINQVARDVADPQKDMSVAERTRAARIVWGGPTQRREAQNRGDLRIGALGSGSDYTPFIQHLGIASLNLGFGGESGGGSYHSAYDTFEHYTRFGDPGFHYGVTLAKTTGYSMMRLANAEIPPFEFGNFAETVGTYLEEVTQVADKMRKDTEQENKIIREGFYDAVNDPKRPLVTPKPKDPVPFLNFAPLQNALANLKESASKYSSASKKLAASENSLSASESRNLARLVYSAERVLTREKGLPRRPWFKHHIYAPGFYTGYGVKTLPGVREALEQRDWQEAEEYIDITAKVIAEYAAHIDKATDTLESILDKN